jgi:hypothetical protein
MMAGTELRDAVGPAEPRGLVATADRTGPRDGGHIGDLANASRLLADRLIAGLDRPFCPTPDELAWVWGGELVRGETRASRARIAEGRYAALLADHVIGDVRIEAAPGAYVRIWLCARLAFIESTTSEPSGSASDGALGAWE